MNAEMLNAARTLQALFSVPFHVWQREAWAEDAIFAATHAATPEDWAAIVAAKHLEDYANLWAAIAATAGLPDTVRAALVAQPVFMGGLVQRHLAARTERSLFA